MPFHSAIYVALGAIFIVMLAYNVTSYRRKYQVGIGSGNLLELDLAIRCHANAVENLPLALLLLFVAEASGLPVWLVHVAGAILLVSRGLHVWGLSRSQGTSFGRLYGTVLCWFTMMALAGFVLISSALLVL